MYVCTYIYIYMGEVVLILVFLLTSPVFPAGTASLAIISPELFFWCSLHGSAKGFIDSLDQDQHTRRKSNLISLILLWEACISPRSASNKYRAVERAGVERSLRHVVHGENKQDWDSPPTGLWNKAPPTDELSGCVSAEAPGSSVWLHSSFIYLAISLFVPKV